MKPWQKTVRYCAIVFAVILIVNIISWSFALLGLVFGSPDTEIDLESQSFEFSADVKDLEIEIHAARFTLKAEDCEKITVRTNLEKLTAKESGSRLKIKDNSKRHKNSDAFVEILYPSDMKFNEVDIIGGAGKLEIVALSCAEFDIELGAGETMIDSLTVAKSADIDGGAGALTFKNADISRLDLDMGVGALMLEGRLSGKSEISLGVGEAVLDLSGQKDNYTLDLEKGLGEITVDGTKVGNSKIGAGENTVKIEGGIGSIKIDFAEDE
ncbi:MAG: DUF4097 family beta strand repeat protein [Clostridia bacterium]|nr:DUF4097 family beta strand repeat protein [Clostridia bacterium]